MQIDNKDSNKIQTFSSKERSWHGLKLTDSAAYHIKDLAKNDPAMLGLRLSIKQSGCAGFGYVVEKVTLIKNDDQIYEHNGARLYVSLKAMPFIDGTELDYVHDGLSSMFKFKNPRAQFTCGCGESFGIQAINYYGKKQF